MRITNKVMQNNSLKNINRNKELQDTLTTQLSTGKKVNKPSDDPVTAIRALRLRSDVNQITQFSKKNVPDAESWLELTESSVKTTLSVVKNMIEQCEKGSSDTLTTADRQIIIDSLKQLRNEVYATGDSDYAGRYIFTGYRTDTPLTYTANTNETFSITQLFSADDLEEATYIDTGDLTTLSESQFEAGGAPVVTEQSIETRNYYRIKLAYDDIDKVLSDTELKLGDTLLASVSVQADKISAYEDMSTSAGKAVVIPSTGELLISKDIYEKIKSSEDMVSMTYEKSNWKSGDLRPQHYFYCTQDNGSGGVIEYNPEYIKKDSLSYGKVDQSIEYQVGFNQSIRVNTPAEDIFKHALGRDVDEIVDLANYLTEVEKVRDTLKSMSTNTEKYTDEQRDNIKIDLEGAERAVTTLRDQLQKKFSSYITRNQDYLGLANDALAEIGNRGARLELISNRLDDQTTTFKTLQSENEDADATEVAVQLSSAQVSYQAALMATSDMIKETLLNYL